MSPRLTIPTIGLGAVVLAVAFLSARPLPSATDDSANASVGQLLTADDGLVEPAREAQRSFDLLVAAPDLDAARIRNLLHESDRMLAVAEEQGVQDLGSELRRRMAEIQVTEQEALAFFSQKRSLFGERSFEESRAAVRQMLVIQKTRLEFSIPR